MHGLQEEHEDIRVLVKPLAELEASLDAGEIENGHTLIALCWLLSTGIGCAGYGQPDCAVRP